MKKLLILALVASFVLGAAITAKADTEVKISGRMDFAIGWMDNYDFGDRLNDVSEDGFVTRERVRTQFEFIANENVRGVLQFEIGESAFGNPNARFDLSGDGVNVETKHAYLQFNIPNTDLLVSIGLQALTVPGVWGSQVFDDDVAALVMSYPINDMFTVVAFWARPYDLNSDTDNTQNGTSLRTVQNEWDEYDLFGLLVPITVKGVLNVTPYFLYGTLGCDVVGSVAGGTISGRNEAQGLLSLGPLTNQFNAARDLFDSENLETWWAGMNFKLTYFDPFTFAFDVIYGDVWDNDEILQREGWFFAAEAAYKMDFMTIALGGWYGTGEDGDPTNGSERFPTARPSFKPTSMGFDGSSLLGTGSFSELMSQGYGDNGGTWGLVLALRNISFIDDLTHTLRVAYYQGTNSPGCLHDDSAAFGPYVNYAYGNMNMIMLTSKDFAWEINFDHKYQIYENLAAYCEMGMVDITRSKKPWTDRTNRIWDNTYNWAAAKEWKTDTAWKLAFGLRYDF